MQYPKVWHSVHIPMAGISTATVSVLRFTEYGGRFSWEKSIQPLDSRANNITFSLVKWNTCLVVFSMGLSISAAPSVWTAVHYYSQFPWAQSNSVLCCQIFRSNILGDRDLVVKNMHQQLMKKSKSWLNLKETEIAKMTAHRANVKSTCQRPTLNDGPGEKHKKAPSPKCWLKTPCRTFRKLRWASGSVSEPQALVTQKIWKSCQNQWTKNCKLKDTWLNCKAVAAVFNTQMKSGSRILWIKTPRWKRWRFQPAMHAITRNCHWSFSFWTFTAPSCSWIVGCWSHRSRLSRRTGFTFVSPSACIKLVGIHLVCFGPNVSWIALMFTKLRLSVNVLLIASKASWRDFESVACRLSNRHPVSRFTKQDLW